MKYLLFTLVFITTYNLNAKFKDSIINLSFISGIYIYEFNNDVTSLNNQNGGFRFSSIRYYDNYCLGLKLQKNITRRKQIAISAIYSKAETEFLRYTNLSANYGTFTKLKLKGLVLNTMIQYQALKIIKINYGFSHYFNFENRFNNEEIAKEVSWYNEAGKSKMKKYSIALCAGFEVKIYKKISFELNTMIGLNDLIGLKIKNEPDKYFVQQKIRYTGLTLNYKL